MQSMQISHKFFINFFLIILSFLAMSTSITQNFQSSNLNLNSIQKGQNITQQMVTNIRQAIKQTALNCTATDRSCYSQIVGMKIQKLYGKSWNVHLLQKSTSVIKGRQYSHDRWITLYNQGQPAFSYYIFKPNDCSKPILFNVQQLINNKENKAKSIYSFDDNEKIKLNQIPENKNLIDNKDNYEPQQYWGSSMTQTLKNRVNTIINDAYNNNPQSIDKNAQYIQSKMGPGRWEAIVWNTPSFDYMNTCMYASYFGLIVGVQRGNYVWSYYVGRMSLI